MEGWIVVSILIIGAFLFSFVGVIVLLAKTKRQDRALLELRRLVETSRTTQTILPFAEAPEAAAPAIAEAAPAGAEARAGETALSGEPPEQPAESAAVSGGERSAREAIAAACAAASGGGAEAIASGGGACGAAAGASPSAEAVPPGGSSRNAPAGTFPFPGQSRLGESLRSFVKGGNLWAAGGVILLIAGFAALIAYLGRRGFFTVEMGIILAAAAGLAMILSGWRFRRKRPVYFLILQGGGIGILYLAVFAAHKLTPYFGVFLSLALMSLLVPPAAIMALFQNSQGLAALGFLGGFAAPLLLSSGGGNHIFLFAYYAALNAGIFAISLFRSWKGLNLLAFFFTFAAALRWTAASYTPEFFLSAELFFLFFIFLFTALGLRGLTKRDRRFRHCLDIILILGTPLAAAALQWKMFSFIPHGRAFIAVGFAAFYLFLAAAILKKGNPAMKSYAEGYLAFGALLANLAIPLELSPGISGAIWAAEGAVLFFIGRRAAPRKSRTGDPRIMAAGGAVHIAAAAAFIRDISAAGAREAPALWRSPAFSGSLVIAVSALAMAAMAEKPPPEGRAAKLRLPLCAAIWGFAWWFGGWLFEIRRALPAPGNAFLLLASISAALCWAAAVFFRLKFFVAGTIPASLAAAFMAIAVFWERAGGSYFSAPERMLSHNFFKPPHCAGWLAFFAAEALTLLFFRNSGTAAAKPDAAAGPKGYASPEPERLRSARSLAAILTALAVLSASGRAIAAEWSLSVSWISLAGLLPLFIALIGYPFWPGRKAAARAAPGERETSGPPSSPADGPGLRFAARFPALPCILSGILGLWFALSLFRPGDPAPLPRYIPVANPLDLLEGLCVVSILFWRIKRNGASPRLIVLGDSMVFLWITAILARSAHRYGGIPWGRVPDSDVFNFCLFVFWAVYGILHIVLGHRAKKRPPWIAGAVLIVADIAKLILFDMKEISAVPRILSFFAAGIVLLFIGWAAPLPPETSGKAPPKE